VGFYSLMAVSAMFLGAYCTRFSINVVISLQAPDEHW